MKLMMHILKENKKLNIDNTTIGAAGIISKLNEEYKEVVTAILNYSENRTLLNLKEILRETYDLIQICILILWRCHRQALDIDEATLIQDINIEHKNKLIGREWTIETGIEIDVKE
ncbi:hypothetical protein FDE76_01590 [Clostridium botulinum]|uniref:Uncharacterized protein n=1 Tax=Clostridium botulinum (strain Eklund 17B / Type B) TaxID=935198 RepID=B2TME8_CLOBB|nr:hypothetical protein CLL_A0935 [Clostridium botulinum B str. Eklund 17B (NRP)]MBY6976801.1 hypothetical protein [Clostridium botulinum]MBY7002294.1 hypothetical protein [Clostridium botulinum]MCR1274103.1 hypothetical protein [Clostridium botulinum]NFD68782.1 hypothetical protein [Clostridium botulinum]